MTLLIHALTPSLDFRLLLYMIASLQLVMQ